MNGLARVLLALLSSSVITVLASIIRYKAISVHLGAAGVGEYGLLLNFVALVAVLFSLGLPHSGVQRVAVTRSHPQEGPAVQRALLYGSLTLALLAALTTLVTSPLFPSHPGGLLIPLAVAATMLSVSQVSLLNGLGLVRQIALVNSLSALGGTLLTVAALWISPAWAIPVALLSTPFLGTVGAWWALRGQGNWREPLPLPDVWKTLPPMARLGVLIALALTIQSGGQYLARVYLQQQYGAVVVGQYQAAWSVTTAYLSVILSALSVEFFPRISRVVNENNRKAVQSSVYRQIILIFGLSLPVICLAILLSGPIIRLMYSDGFEFAASLAQQQFVGDVIKLPCWVLSYVLVAKSKGGVFFMSELLTTLSYLASLVWLDSVLGVDTIGWAYAISYSVFFAYIAFEYRRNIGTPVPSKSILPIVLALSIVIAHYVFSRSGWNISVLMTIDIIALAIIGWQHKDKLLRRGNT